MNENWYALYISIIKCCTPEQSIRAIQSGKLRAQDRDSLELLWLRKQGFTYTQIGDIAGISRQMASRIINLKKDT